METQDLQELLNLNIDSLSGEQLREIHFKLKRMNLNDLKSYIPHAKQKEFHMAPHKTRCWFGGNRSGKSRGGCQEALMRSTGIYPSWYPENLKTSIPNKGRIIVSDFAKGWAENVEPYIKRFLPNHLIKSQKKNHEGYVTQIELMNGSKFDICTWEQDQNVFEGWSGHWAWFDEPPPRDKYIATTRGLIDFKGKAWLTLTPLSEPWMWDELVCKAGKNIFVLTSDSYDNPYVPQEEIKTFEEGLRPEEKEARIHGKFLHLTGLVYKAFDRNIHCKELDLSNPESVYSKMDKSWYFILDPHDRRPHCGIWAFVNPQEKRFIAYELFYESDNLTDLCTYILAFEKTHRIPSSDVIRIGDPNKMETPTAVTGLKLKVEFLMHDDRLAFITNVDDNIQVGHMAVKEALSYNKNKPVDTLNSPAIYFNNYETIPHVIEMFQKYIYQEWKGAFKDSKNPKEAPKDLNKDMPDCVRYFLMFNPTYIGDFSSQSSSSQRTRRSRTGYR